MPRQTVLIADDEPSILHLMELFFTAEGLAVLTARDGQQALDLVASEQPAAVVVDLRMPVLDGYAVVGRLRAAEATRCIPIVAISAERQACLNLERLQVDAFFPKPFELDQLVDKVKSLMVQ